MYGEAKRQQILNSFLEKAQTVTWESAVGIVFNENKEILLGLSLATDDRKDKWCFPGGGIEEGETVLSAAQREVQEETGIVTNVMSTVVLFTPIKPNVGFVLLKNDSEQKIMTDKTEFKELKYFSLKKLPENFLPINLQILKTLNLIKKS